MAKNTNSSKFRRIDVDQFTDDNFLEDVGDGPTEISSAASLDDDAFVKTESLRDYIHLLLAKGQALEALQLVLKDPPVRCKDSLVKDLAFSCVMEVLTFFKGAENIEYAINNLDKESIDVLMKYLYRGFEMPTCENVNCSVLLLWHEKAVTKGGLGSIIRVMTDRKKV